MLADCLHHAVEQGAERLVDLATLTGAIVTTLGTTYAGLMGTDDDWCEEVSAAGRRAGEILWRLPLHPEYADLIKGQLRRHPQRGREPPRRVDHRRGVPQALRRRRALGAPRHRGRRVGHQQGLRAQGRHRLRRAPAGRARLDSRGVAADKHRNGAFAGPVFEQRWWYAAVTPRRLLRDARVHASPRSRPMSASAAGSGRSAARSAMALGGRGRRHPAADPGREPEPRLREAHPAGARRPARDRLHDLRAATAAARLHHASVEPTNDGGVPTLRSDYNAVRFGTRFRDPAAAADRGHAGDRRSLPDIRLEPSSVPRAALAEGHPGERQGALPRRAGRDRPARRHDREPRSTGRPTPTSSPTSTPCSRSTRTTSRSSCNEAVRRSGLQARLIQMPAWTSTSLTITS